MNLSITNIITICATLLAFATGYGILQNKVANAEVTIETIQDDLHFLDEDISKLREDVASMKSDIRWLVERAKAQDSIR